MLTRDTIHGYREDDLRKKVVIPLLKAMGYRDVEHYHGQSGELGKDVTAWKPNDLGNRRNLVVVVKAGNISGQAARLPRSAGDVATQVRQAFGSPFIDKADGSHQHAHECWILTNGTIGKQAREAISAELRSSNLNIAVQYIDEDELWRLVKKHLQVLLLQRLQEVQAAIRQGSAEYEPRITITPGNVQVNIRAKPPRGVAESQFVGRVAFDFPDTEEGNAVRQSFEQYLATGEPTEVSARFIREIQHPPLMKEIARQLFGIDDLGATDLRLVPPPVDRLLIARVEIRCTDGDQADIDYVELRYVQGGFEEFTLSNRDQAVPIRVELKIRLREQVVITGFGHDTPSLNAVQWLDLLRLYRCISKPATIRFISRETNLPFLEVTRTDASGDSPTEFEFRLAETLVRVQEKTDTPIALPPRAFREEEFQTILRLRHIVETARLTGTWDEFSFTTTSELLGGVLAPLLHGEAIEFAGESEERVSLFGISLSLGRVRIAFSKARLSNTDDVRMQLKQTTGQEIVCHLKPDGQGTFVKDYQDWVPETQDEIKAIVAAPPSDPGPAV